MKYWKIFIKLFTLYFVGCVFGFIIENIYSYITHETFQIRQGLLYGPFIPVYGIGAIMFYGIYVFTKKPLNVFIASVVIGGFVEFMASLLQEKIFGTVSWDYSNTFFNIAGRTNLMYSFYWGCIGLLFLYIAPYIDKADIWIENKNFKILVYFLMFIMIADILITTVAAMRQTERMKGIEASSRLDVYLDEHYSDEVLDKVYNNKKWVIKDKN